MGRATKAMAKVASDCSVAAFCCRRIALREEDMRKHNNGRSGVNVKVEELNGRANERGDKDFITRVDRRVFLLVVECCGCCLHNLFLFFG